LLYTNTPILYFDYKSLPSEPVERQSFLLNYFVDHYPACYFDKYHNSWVVKLCRPKFKEFYVDPKIRMGLDFWDRNLNIEMLHMSFRLQQDNYLEALNDNWTIYLWSKWWSNLKTIPNIIHIIHFDDHKDLMSPLLTYNNGKILDMITRKVVDLKNPESVKSAIESGAIGIGSFITAFLVLLEKKSRVYIHHVTKRPEKICRKSIILEKIPDTLFVNDKRFKTTLRQYNDLESKSVYQYVLHNTVFNLYSKGKFISDEFLLHLDMDYFSNPFDRDSEWKKKNHIFNPPIEVVKKNIEDVMELFSNAKVKTKLQNVSVALSPGFFPAEYWEYAIKKSSALVNRAPSS
jgi:hypothetical protein